MAERLIGLKQGLTPQDNSRASNVANLLAEGVLGALPGAGDALAARDSQIAGAQMAKALRQGQYGDAALSGAEALLNGLGALPAVPALGGMLKAFRGGPQRVSDELPQAVDSNLIGDIRDAAPELGIDLHGEIAGGPDEGSRLIRDAGLAGILRV